jgi:type I restriction-modification system DNA methylase subunit
MPADSMDEGRAQIAALVERFFANEQHYTSAGFDETSTREQFINGLFDALGWDVLDAAGRGASREVVFHPRLRDDGGELRGEEEWDEDLSEDELAEREPVARIPDYAFRYDGATRFFVEAKRAGVPLDARAPAFQVKSYAWSHRVRVGVLTNFRQLRVFATITRPEYNDPGGGLIAGLTLDCRDYVERWPQIWALLSREAVAAGSIEKTARYRRGALQVDEAFLTELTEWREIFARDLVERNLDLDRWELAEATQRILDRLIFLRVCEDRTLEQDVVLRRYARRTDAYRHLQAEMRRLDATYNGALFAPHFSERLEVSDAVIQRFIERLYFPYSPYRFDVIGVDLLGNVYERFLGTEITLRNGQVRVEEKPEVRHAGGVYYTPGWVVRQIVETTIGPLLEGRTPRTAEALRIVDPACGSGSFLLGALDYLTEWHEAYYTANPNTDPDRHMPREDGSRRLTSDAKASIVRNNLYGVDIDPQAVEVAQMSLYLKILESETSASLHEQTRLFPEPFLPALNRNILSGNSLLGTDEVPAQLLLDDELRHRINPFDWRDENRGFGGIFAERGGFDAVIGNPPYTRVQVLRRERGQETELYDQHFQTAQASYDIASLFVERGLGLLRGTRGRDRGGRLGFIITRTFCETDAGEPLRRLLSAQRHVSEITDFGAGTVFGDDVSAYTLLLFLSREPNQSYRLTRVPHPPTAEMLALAKTDGMLSASKPAATLTEEPWDLLLPSEETLLDRLSRAHPSLREVSGNSIFQGVVTGADLVFRCEDAGPDPDDPALRRVVPLSLPAGSEPISVEQACLRPVVAGSNDLHRFRSVEPHEWLILPYEPGGERYQAIGASGFERRFPRAFAWLEQNRAQLEGRTLAAAIGPWNDENFILYSRRQNLELFPEPKVMVPYMIRELTAIADERGCFFVNVTSGGYGVGLDEQFGLNREYLAALLNSELLSWVLKRYSRSWRGDYFGARKGNLSRLPIYVASDGEQQQVIAAFDDCVATAEALDEAQSDADREMLGRAYTAAVAVLDRLAFDLYEISDDELRVIRSL